MLKLAKTKLVLFMYGNNPKRGIEKGDGSLLDIQEIFPTLQGEGPNVGMPAIFIRLGGCNLACSFCDTEFESFKKLTIEDILEETCELSLEDKTRTRHLVVITGGEPLRQPIEQLCKELLKNGFKVQIETNGTIFRDLPKEVEIICSPKNNGKGYFPIREDLLERINAFKFIISSHNPDYKSVPDIGQKKYKTPVYVQPMDEYNKGKNQENLAAATSIAQKNGYFLSIQMHKIAGIR